MKISSPTLRSACICLAFLAILPTAYTQEICHNLLDDDNDGLTDLTDPDCHCYDTLTYVSTSIYNPSFEQMDCCPTGSDISCATNWLQPTEGTPDYFNCGLELDMDALAAAGITASDGVGFVGAFFTPMSKEYVSACTFPKLSANELYRLELDVAAVMMKSRGKLCGLPVDNLQNVEVGLFGTADCGNIPMPSSFTADCPTPDEADGPPQTNTDWVLLGSATYDPSNGWQTIGMTFTPPFDIDAIMIGPPCDLPPSYPHYVIGGVPDTGACLSYILMDNLKLTARKSFLKDVPAPDVWLDKPAGEKCGPKNYVFTADSIPGATVYWTGPGLDTVPGRALTVNGFTAGNNGTYSAYYISDGCTSLTAVVDAVAEPDSTTAIGKVTLPNIITPNGDGQNDILNIPGLANACDPAPFEIKIWNRWGNVIFEQKDAQPPFTGKNNLGNRVPAGVYFYSLRYEDKLLKSTLTVSY